jgi:hypothetical protein
MIKNSLILFAFSLFISVLSAQNQPNPIKKDGKFGFKEYGTGVMVTGHIYDFAEQFSPFTQTALVGKGEKYGMITPDGKELIPCKYDSKFHFSNGLGIQDYYAIVESKSKFGIVNLEGVEIVPCKYEKRIELSEESMIGIIAHVESKDLHGIYSVKEKRELIPCKSDKMVKYIGIATDGTRFFIMSNEGKIGVSTDPFKLAIPCKYDEIDFAKLIRPESKNAEIQVSSDKKVGILNAQGLVLIPCKYDKIEPSAEAKYRYVVSEKKYGLIDMRSHTLVVPCKYGDAETLWEKEYPRLSGAK